MFLPGIASLLQLLILPGFIILRLLKITTANAVQTWLYSFGLSLYANYCAVCLLTWLHLYTPPAVFAIFALEAVAALAIIWRSRPVFSRLTVREIHERFRNFVSSLAAWQKPFFLAACLVLLFFASLVPFSAGTAYYFSDALMHWTRWPAAWAADTFPTGTSHYPQLFPANLSLIHIFTGAPLLRFFPKLLMPAFFIGNLLIFIDLCCAKRSFVYLAGFFIYSAFLLNFYSILFILEVNADIPVSFFAFLTFYAALRGSERAHDGGKTILLAAAFAVAAANTKLAGMYILAPAGAYILRFVYLHRADLERRTFVRMLAALVVIFAAGFFWYAVRPAEMIGGLNQSVYLKPDYASRFSSAATMLLYTMGAPFMLFIAATLALSAASREGRMLLGIMVAPALILWMFFFSADYRNLSFVIPFASLASAYGLKVVYRKFVRTVDVPHALAVPRIPAAAGTLLLMAAAAGVIVIVRTDAFFNLCMDIAYGLNVYVFRYYRVVYTTELGYYRSVELLCSALSLASLLVLIASALRFLRINAVLLALCAGAAAVIGLAFMLNDTTLWRRQADDEQMTAVRNCYYRMRPSLQPYRSALVMTNNAAFAHLIPPRGASFAFSARPEADSAAVLGQGSEAAFILLEQDLSRHSTADTSALHRTGLSISECFNDGSFALYRLGARSKL